MMCLIHTESRTRCASRGKSRLISKFTARSRTFMVPRSYSNQKSIRSCLTRNSASASGLLLTHPVAAFAHCLHTTTIGCDSWFCVVLHLSIRVPTGILTQTSYAIVDVSQVIITGASLYE
jgi:hypothetical protein